MKRSTFITWDQLRVGILLLVALGVLTFVVIKLGHSAKLFSKRVTLVAFVPNAAGLRVGGQVTVAGQMAGSIKAIEFLSVDSDTTRNLRVVVEVDEKLQPQVRGDSRVLLRNQGLLGDKMFDITPGTPQFNMLASGDTLYLGNSVDYEQMIQQASSALNDVVGLTHDLKAISTGLLEGKGTAGQLLTDKKLYTELTTVLDRTSAVLSNLQNPNGSVGKLLSDPALFNNLTAMVSQVDTLINAMHNGNGTFAKMLRDDSLYNNMVKVTGSADSLVSMMANGNGTAARLFKEDGLYNELVSVISKLNAVLEDIRKDPKRYTKGAIRIF